LKLLCKKQTFKPVISREKSKFSEKEDSENPHSPLPKDGANAIVTFNYIV